MPVSTQRKAEIVQEFARGANDSGSAEVQIALLTASIKELTEHLKIHRKDNGTRRGLLSQVSRRARLLRYLRNVNAARYSALVSRLGLRG
ncbi:MAG: 30S ribosomal protein S15 [Planctomycetota bacterium]|nr:30S ribosomal protein S15 [Planctomycetota bacterium]